MADNRERMLSLAKVLIAAAWADGEITVEEQYCLKDVIFHLSDAGVQLSAQEWELLEMYIEAPVGAEERERLVLALQDSIRSADERQFVLNALRQMAMADGVSGADEQQAIDAITRELQSTDAGLMVGLNRLLGRSLNRRSTAVAAGPNREAYFDDFLRNKVYYETNRRLREEGLSLNLGDAQLRKLGLAGGLMARIAKVDENVSETEFEAMVRSLTAAWGLSREEAIFVANVAVSSLGVTYDYYRMTREFATSTTLEERQKFLVTLFLIAGADQGASFDETEEIRLVSMGINLSHEDFINAKLAAKKSLA